MWFRNELSSLAEVSLYLFDMSCNSTHLLTNSTNFPSTSGSKQAALEVQWRRRDTAHIIGIAQQRRRNGTETWRRRSCQCEHLRLITHEKILPNGDVGDGTETWRIGPYEAYIGINVVLSGCSSVTRGMGGGWGSINTCRILVISPHGRWLSVVIRWSMLTDLGLHCGMLVLTDMCSEI